MSLSEKTRSLTIKYRNKYKVSTFSSIILRPRVLVRLRSEPRPPGSQINALSTELIQWRIQGFPKKGQDWGCMQKSKVQRNGDEKNGCRVLNFTLNIQKL